MNRRTICFQSLCLACCFILTVVGEHEIRVPNQGTYTVTVLTPPIYLGEGPHWDVASQSLYFVDLLGQRILRQEYKTGDTTEAKFDYGPVGAVVPVKDKPGKLLVACKQSILLVSWDGKKNVTNPPYIILARLENQSQDTRVNDGKCDQLGRFWIGTMANEHDGKIKPNQGALYSYDGRLKKHLVNISISNGLAWNSRNDVMYYIDSMSKKVVSYRYELEAGCIADEKVVFDLVQNNFIGIPDGMTIDTNNNLWVVDHDGYSVLQIHPKTGKLLKTIELPARRVTSVAFGGPKLDILFVTSAYHGVNEHERDEMPYSGSVFAIKNLGVSGLPANNFVFKKVE